LDFVGRRDQQVKVRGYRVELGEIEAAIATHESVAEAIVSALEDPNGNRLVAHVVPKPLRSIDPARLRAFLADRLPDHFLPSAVQVIADLPRSPNGKVDRNALSASAPRRDGLQQSYVAPAGAIEEWLAHEWSAVLGLPTVGRHDPFFELGGTSIQAAEIVTRLQQRLDEFVFVVLMFECPTISELASRLRRDYADALGRLFPSEVPRNVRGAGKARSTLDESRLVEVARRLYRAPIRAAGRTNPPAVFILAPPRSGTTLLAAMLGGHPDLFVAPELNLFGFDRMGHRRDECQDAASVWLDGTIRAVMNIYGLSADDAVARVKRAEHANVTVAEQVAALQSAIAPRLLVDKSPAYGLRLETLRQIEATVRSARYVHLSRHPAAMIRSFAEHHMDQIYLNGDTLPPREAGEAVWVITHRNILQFLGSVASDRQVHVRYEDLVLEPEREMHRVSDALGREFHAAMLNPYGAGSCERLAGVHPQSKPLGDPRFLTFNRITDERIQDTRNRDEIESLGAPARSVARSLGYDLADSDTPSEVAGAYARARHMRASLQRRLAGRKAGSPSRTDA
jgi:hypothetical protein